MKDHRSWRKRLVVRSAWQCSLVTFAIAAGWLDARAASAAPIKIACIGEHTTHSHSFPALNRESQPVGMQEYPAMLQTLLGPAYQVRNFGDCCGSVLQGYTPAETHPYVLGALSAAEGPGYNESIAFQPDIVVIGSWGRHDWGMAKAPAEMWDVAKFETDYEDLVRRYIMLPSHPLIFASLPIPIPNGEAAPATGVATSTVLPAVRNVASKYHLPIIDLYSAFLGHKELFKQPPDTEGEGEHVTNGPGLQLIADTVRAAIVGYQSDGGTIADAAGGATDAAAKDAPQSIDLDSSPETGGEVPEASNSVGAGGAAAGTGGANVSSSAATGGTSTGVTGTAGTVGTGGANSGGMAGAASSSSVANDPGCSCSMMGQSQRDVAWISWLIGGLALIMERRARGLRYRRAGRRGGVGGNMDESSTH